jgi:signal transduction histidine kinase
MTGLFTSATVFLKRSEPRVSELLGEQAHELSYALAQASKTAMLSGKAPHLAMMGQDLIRGRNILYAAFLDQQGKPIAFASRDPNFTSAYLSNLPKDLLEVRHVSSAALGPYVEACAPVMEIENAKQRKLLGFVAVGISEAHEQSMLRTATFSTIGLVLMIVTASVPIAILLIHRVFLPIRELVKATKRMAGGELNVQVNTTRKDVIGDLSRSFNEMVQVVQRQQIELQRVNDDLEKTVEQRTAQLTREIAEKEDFLRAVSHDLNAPLRNISGMATMLLVKHGEKLDADIVHRLERIKKNVEAETDLIAELLELSRIKTKRQKSEPVELQKLVQEIADLFEDDLHRKQIALRIETPLPTVLGETLRLRQVFQNLIDNAIKYMGEGDLRQIYVGCSLGDDRAEFYVRDTGLGIDAEDVEKVFFVFRRGKNSQATNIAGKGVGLASVKSIIETYNGSIWVESEPGKGSTFRFTIDRQFVPEIRRTRAA